MITAERKDVLRARALAAHKLMPAYVVPMRWRFVQLLCVASGTIGAILVESWVAAGDPHISGVGPFATEVPTHSAWSLLWALVWAVIWLGQTVLTEWVEREPDQGKVNRVLNVLWFMVAAWGVRNAVVHHRQSSGQSQ